MTDQVNRYEQLSPEARALLADFDELDLAEILAGAQAAIARVRALHQPTGVVAAAEFGNPPDCPTCGPNRWPCPTYEAVTKPEPMSRPA